MEQVTPLLDNYQRLVAISKGGYNAYNNKTMRKLSKATKEALEIYKAINDAELDIKYYELQQAKAMKRLSNADMVDYIELTTPRITP